MPMSAFGTAFTGEARRHAQRLFEEGRVKILTQDEAFVSTQVRDGASPERVLVRRRPDRLQVSCTCTRGSTGACAHILATMLAVRDTEFGAQHAPSLQSLVSGRRLQLRSTRPVSEFDVPAPAPQNVEDSKDQRVIARKPTDEDDEDEGPDADEEAYEEADEAAAEQVNTPESEAFDSRPVLDWRFRLAKLKAVPATRYSKEKEAEQDALELAYVIDASASRSAATLVVVIGHREKRRDGTWGRVKFARPFRGLVSEARDAQDREVLHLLSGADRDADLASAFRLHDAHRVASRYRIAPELHVFFARKLAETGRLFLRRSPDRAHEGDEETPQLVWDAGSSYHLALALGEGALEIGDEETPLDLSGALVRANESGDTDRLNLADLELVTAGGLAISRSRIATFEPVEHAAWLDDLARRGSIRAPRRHEDRMLRELADLPPTIDLSVAPVLGVERIKKAPSVFVRFSSFPKTGSTDPVAITLLFDYAGQLVDAKSPKGGFLEEPRDDAPRRLLARDAEAEALARRTLIDAGASITRDGFAILPEETREFLSVIANASFRVLVRDREVRQMRGLRFRVSSGVDWFDLKGGLDFGSEVVPWPILLKSIQRGETLVRLSDGSQGVIPEALIARYSRLVRLGAVEGEDGDKAHGAIRFGKSQIALLDAMLAGEKDIEVDAAFETARDKLRSFERVHSAQEPKTFQGELRPYQREGLGWMEFLREFSFGGCLADDMGLGKTVQVLALLEGRRLARIAGETVPPSLVVVPRSLVFNWKQEAAKFAPELRVLDHTGPLRSHTSFEGYDIVLSTYGTLRSDVARWQGTNFDYAILDEAQAIKNPTTESARAARLIRARYRLALSGTPVENRVGELLSIFSFINPSVAAGSMALTELASERATPAEREILSRGLRPFVLRRRKEEVLQDLPPKFEETLYCELGAEQRKVYEELKAHFRFRITALLETQGLAKSRIQVLEALLRLRQAACHPGLLDDARIDEQDAKLETLLPRISEVAAEGHRALVFSQFTSYLAILRRRLEANGIRYSYLDGKTRDRKGVVETFEQDPTIPVFLVSLKAGGLGLNLTAADYVFILDPWWNPAAEMQAIARAHRIGQQRPVFAYRLVAKDTVEEKVIELQQKKRELVETLLGVDKSAIGALRREDIELLLS